MGTGDAADAVRDRLQRALGEGFVFKGRLGHGGFAVVYEVADERLKRRLAVKVLRAELDDAPGARERFRREAEAVAALRHPNVIPIYSVGEAQGLAFFVMPLIEGGSLADRLAREPRQSAEEARRSCARRRQASPRRTALTERVAFRSGYRARNTPTPYQQGFTRQPAM